MLAYDITPQYSVRSEQAVSGLVEWIVRLGVELRNAIPIHTQDRRSIQMRIDLACRSEWLSLSPRGRDRRWTFPPPSHGTLGLLYNADVLPSRPRSVGRSKGVQDDVQPLLESIDTWLLEYLVIVKIGNNQWKQLQCDSVKYVVSRLGGAARVPPR